MTNRIVTGRRYQHEKYGRVFVSCIAKMYQQWDVDGPQEDIDSGKVVVHFFNMEGGENIIPEYEPVNEFAKAVAELEK